MLTNVAQIEGVAVAREHLSAQPGMVGGFEPWVGRKQLLGFAAGFFQNRPIAAEIGDPQRRQAVLLRAEQVARAAEFEIHFGQFEAVGRCGKRIEPRAGLLGQFLADHHAQKPAQFAAADAAAQVGGAGPAQIAPANRSP